MSLGLAATVFASIADASSPMLLKWGVDALQAGKPEGWIFLFSGLIILIAAVGGLFRFWMRDIIVGLSRWIECDIRESFFRHLQKLPPIFFDRNHTGDLMARAKNDVERVRMALGPALLYAASTQLTIIFSAAMMFWLDAYLAALLLLLAPVVGGAMLWVARSLHKASLTQQAAYGALSTVVQENVSGLRIIKSYAREDYEASRFDGVCRDYFRKSLRVARMQALMFPMITFLIGLGVAGILWVGGRQVVVAEISLGDFIAFNGYLTLMTWPMIALGWVVHLYQRGAASDKRLTQIFEEPEQFERSDSPSTAASTASDAPEIAFDAVSLRYREDGVEVLKEVSFVVPAGKTVAVVGQTGSHKSSLARALTRLYLPHAGEIRIAGRNWSAIPPAELRRMIAYVDQAPFLFSATIEENIKFGSPDAPDEAMEAAAYTACFDRDVSQFPQGYRTLIGERGVTLSGGQQQRLTLARALLTDAPALALDDALSAVDADTEAEILRRLKERASGRTLIFITHRLAAAEIADSVAVLDEGRLVEFGAPDELIAAGGAFARMYRLQRLAKEIEEL